MSGTTVVTTTRRASDSHDVAASVTVQDTRERDREDSCAGGADLRGLPRVFFRCSQGDVEGSVTIDPRGNDTFPALLGCRSFADDRLLMRELPCAAVDGVEIVRGPVQALRRRCGQPGGANYLTLDPASNTSHLPSRFGIDGCRRAQEMCVHPADSGAGVAASISHQEADGRRGNNARDSALLRNER